MGRSPLGERAMTPAEKQRRYRERKLGNRDAVTKPSAKTLARLQGRVRKLEANLAAEREAHLKLLVRDTNERLQQLEVLEAELSTLESDRQALLRLKDVLPRADALVQELAQAKTRIAELEAELERERVAHVKTLVKLEGASRTAQQALPYIEAVRELEAELERERNRSKAASPPAAKAKATAARPAHRPSSRGKRRQAHRKKRKGARRALSGTSARRDVETKVKLPRGAGAARTRSSGTHETFWSGAPVVRPEKPAGGFSGPGGANASPWPPRAAGGEAGGGG
jgi:hypothetical protein